MLSLKTINTKLDLLLKQVRKPAPLSVDEACKYLNIKKATLYKLTANRYIPYYKPNGQTIYFDIQDLENYVYSNKVDTLDTLQEKINRD